MGLQQNTMKRSEAGKRLRQLAASPRTQRARTLARGPAVRTHVGISTIPGAGRGLFCDEHVERGDVVARYSGRMLTREQARASTSKFILKISDNVYLDAQSIGTWEGRWINDGPHSGREPNCVFASAFNTNKVPDSEDRWIKVFATKHIGPGEEILMSYGPEYWDHHARPPGEPGRQYFQQTNISTGARPKPRAITAQGLTLDLLAAVNAQLPDALAYIGSEAYKHVLASDVFYCEEAVDSYITTAALRRSGCHPEPSAVKRVPHNQTHDPTCIMQ